MTFRGEFDPTGFDITDPDTYPQTDQRDEITDDLLYDDGDRWTVTADGTFQGLDLTADGRLFARVVTANAIEFGGAPLQLAGAPLVVT